MKKRIKLVSFSNTHKYRKEIGYIVFLLLFLVAVVTSIYYRYSYVRQKSMVHTYPLSVWQVGDIVDDQRFIFSFNGVRSDVQDIPHAWELSPDYQFVMVNVSFKNLTNADYQLSPITLMQIEDDNHTVYNVTSAPLIKDSIGGPVHPGQTVRGEVGFTMPKNIQSGSFVFNPGLIDAQYIRVKFSL